MLANPNWKNEFQRAFKKLSDLYQFLDFHLDPELEAVAKAYPVFVPYRLAERIKETGPASVLAREFLPDRSELDEKLNTAGRIDPIGDKVHQVAPQLIHRYQNRVLFTPTSVCPVHCRYCFRKNELTQDDELFQAQMPETLNYLKKHREISEIIFTGGDPFTLSTSKLKFYLLAFAEIPHIKHIRFHSRYPVIMPERFDEELIALLRETGQKFQTLSLAIHVNHADEFDVLAIKTISKLAELPLQLLSQTVLLKNVNDSRESLLELMHELMKLKVRPYYLHHPDQVRGGMHFYVPLSVGRKIYAALRTELPGWALPQYVIDVPGGEGKISAFNPESFDYSGSILTLEGNLILSKEPPPEVQ